MDHFSSKDSEIKVVFVHIFSPSFDVISGRLTTFKYLSHSSPGNVALTFFFSSAVCILVINVFRCVLPIEVGKTLTLPAVLKI